jgi:dTDP-glucose pyrophosphorylase/predicted transcriptional regulator
MNQIKCCVSEEDSIQNVLNTLQESVHHICLVVNEVGKLVGTITDGDCRRGFLKGFSLESKANSIMQTNFIAVDSSFNNDQILRLMRTNCINQIPVLDDSGKVLDIISNKTILNAEVDFKRTALILAGGEGKRLYPLTQNIPKPMLPVSGKPMLEIIVENLVKHHFNNIYISINYLGNVIEDYFKGGETFNCRINYISENIPLGTAGPIKLIQDKIEYPLLVMNGDLVTDVNLSGLLEYHLSNNFNMTIGTYIYKSQIPYGIIELNENGTVYEIKEKPSYSHIINAGIYIIEPNLINYIPSNKFYPMNELIAIATSNNFKIGAFLIHEKWVDVGIPEQYFSVQTV